MNREEYWFWLCNIPGIFREDIRKMLEIYQTPKAVFKADAERLLRKGLLSGKQAAFMEQSKKRLGCLQTLEQIKKEGIRFLYPEDPDFPEKLRVIPDPPYGLYVRGAVPDPERPSVGMVGARACSEYGKGISLKFAETLAAGGVQIISGLAAGIDSVSARGALLSGGRTFAVLGSGLDVIYPAENIDLYYQIVTSGGGVISEYPIGTKPVPWQFPLRNRLISGLSDRLLVMEAKERSGTMITVRYALDQGKDVYALPGRVTDKTSKGCNQLIADGAGILRSPEDLLSEIFQKPAEVRNREKTEEKRTEEVRPDLENIYRQIGNTPVSVQYIIEKTQETPEKTAFSIAELELSGLVREVSKNHYVRTF